MTGTNCDLFTHKQSRSYLNHLVHADVRTDIRAAVCSSTLKTEATVSSKVLLKCCGSDCIMS
jgi:hypothetical protein